jgi:hypothetical protein
MSGIYLDAETQVVGEHYAVIYAPRRARGRFPENCVERVASAAAAIAAADPSRSRHPAKVVGPSRSSEGVRLYYVVAWLDGPEQTRR